VPTHTLGTTSSSRVSLKIPVHEWSKSLLKTILQHGTSQLVHLCIGPYNISIIRPVLKYPSIARNLWLCKDITALDSVQKM